MEYMPRLTNLAALGLDGDLVSKDNFQLPTLGPKLDQVRREVYDGKGFGVVRGLDPQRYRVEDLTMLYLGIQVYIANRSGRQDHKGNMMGTRTDYQTPFVTYANMPPVHIVADHSSQVAAGHHRHSTAPIVSHAFLLQIRCANSGAELPQ